MEQFVVKHYTAEERPTIKGNGFDGLEVGGDREEAEEFVAWVNERLATTEKDMDGKEKAGWLADKICNGGDYAKEAAIVLVRQAEEIERLREDAKKWQALAEANARLKGLTPNATIFA